MRKKINIICWVLSAISFLLLVILSINAIVDHQAVDMLSAVVVQVAFGAFFIAFFIGAILTIEK